MRSKEDLAWLAGFWDGEGCVSPLKSGKYKYYPVFSLSQAGDEGYELCQRVLDSCGIFGGISGPYTSGTYKPVYKVRISGYEKVQALLSMCWPWLSNTKRVQASAILTEYRKRHLADPPMSKTECANGHKRTKENGYYDPRNRSWRCRVCRRKSK